VRIDEQLVTDFVEALLAGDLDTVMRYYDDRSVLSVSDVSNNGPAEIRKHFEAALAGSPEGSDFVRSVETDPDGRVALRWKLYDKPGGSEIASGEDYFRIDADIIVEQVVVHHH
jgi:ketosteroid isomerase-like protein